MSSEENGQGGDISRAPILRRGITYSPGVESGLPWHTQYSPNVTGVPALQIGQQYLSNFLTRDIGGRTAGICINPWDFNFLTATTIDGTTAERPLNYAKTSFQRCDCSYHECDKQLQGISYTFDMYKLWNGEGEKEGIAQAFDLIGRGICGADDRDVVRTFDEMGFPKALRDSGDDGSYLSQYGSKSEGSESPGPFQGNITLNDFNAYKAAVQNIPLFGRGDAGLFTYAMMDFCKSTTGGLNFKNNIISALALAQDTFEITTQDWGAEWEEGGGTFSDVARDIARNYEKGADIPGFVAEFVYSLDADNIQSRCMCLDGGMYGYDALPFADYEIVRDQITKAGGIEAFSVLGFTGNEVDLGKFFTIDGERLKILGITEARPYKYGPNWAYGSPLAPINTINVSVPEYKNWEVRESSKIRMSGEAQDEPYSFGNQWLDWSQRIGVPPVLAVNVDSKTLGGGDFADANFGFRGNINGSLIYRGNLPGTVIPYEGQEYEFAFVGITSGSFGNGNNTYWIGVNTIDHLDYITNAEAYGTGGSVEDIVFDERFSESPQDKTIYRM